MIHEGTPVIPKRSTLATPCNRCAVVSLGIPGAAGPMVRTDALRAGILNRTTAPAVERTRSTCFAQDDSTCFIIYL
jgi:hypothetical protein